MVAGGGDQSLFGLVCGLLVRQNANETTLAAELSTFILFHGSKLKSLLLQLSLMHMPLVPSTPGHIIGYYWTKVTLGEIAPPP